MKAVRIGLIGDYQPHSASHISIPRALTLSSSSSKRIDHAWLPTPALRFSSTHLLEECHGLWLAPGDRYESHVGVLNAIRFAREYSYPFLATGLGCTFVLIEYLRNIKKLLDADHEAINPQAKTLAVTKLSEPLRGVRRTIKLRDGSRVCAMYGCTEIEEEFDCEFGLNPACRDMFAGNGLSVCAEGALGEVYAVEISTHPYFVATMFSPSIILSIGQINPLVFTFIEACRRRQTELEEVT